MNTNVKHPIRVYLCSFVVPGLETSLQLADTQKTVQSGTFNPARSKTWLTMTIERVPSDLRILRS